MQLCELANPAKWDNPAWRRTLDALRLPAEKKLAMHRKAYEFTQTAWGLDRLGALTEDATVVSVGAGHESLAYWLAKRVRLVVATNLYPTTGKGALAPHMLVEIDGTVFTSVMMFLRKR